MARWPALLVTLLLPRCGAEDPLVPPGGQFSWGPQQPYYTWGQNQQPQTQPQPSHSNTINVVHHVLLPNPPAPPPSSTARQFWAGPTAAATTPAPLVQTVPPTPATTHAGPLPPGEENVQWISGQATATSPPQDDLDLPQPPEPQFTVENFLPEGTPLAGCHGYEEHWALCTETACSNYAQPIDCAWGAWGQWESFGGCSGLGIRSRKIARMNSENGAPCGGVKEETMQMDQYFDDDCLMGNRDCEWSPWSDWSHCGCDVCGEDRKAQTVRYRHIANHALGTGEACSGKFNMTKPCGYETPVQCALSEWGQWTRCSATCGGGVRASLRRVDKEADYGGLPCVASLRKTETCNTQPCQHNQDCVVSEWGAWHGCEVQGAMQMTRQRRIETYAEGEGEPCDAPLTETAGCENRDSLQWCSTTEWSQWSTCPVACGGGQQQRVRHLSGESTCIPMAKQDLKELRGCNTESCEENEGCLLSPWTQWGQCSQDCGTGVSTRTRSIDQSAGDGGKSCHASLKEMQECEEKPCPVRDCVWAAWDHWSGCSCTCGGGLKRRARTIKEAPRAGGTPCEPSDKTQVAECNTRPCEDCVDGLWTSWSLWSECTASCTPGYRWRHRSVARRANDCGQPVTGLEEDYEMCEDLPVCEKDDDCKVSEWTSWNDCSCSCYGVTERHRRVIKLGSGAGKKCQEKSLKEIAPCNPGEEEAHPQGCRAQGPENCTLSHWEDWGVCSKPCGVGQRTRMRQILRPLNHNGAPCEGELAQVVPCNTHHCPENNCIDCQWGPWSEWGDCSECNGQKYRQRTIQHLQNDCGHKCNPGIAKETMNCTGTCDVEYYCRWSDWSDLGDCTATCGTAVRILQRRLEITDMPPESDQDYNSSAGGTYLYAGSQSMVCSGEQTKSVECDTPSCNEDCYPRNCRFGEWGPWSEPSCTQLCNRHRVLALRSSCGGKPCAGAQSETKSCPRAPCVEVVDCTISEWDDWSYCTKETGYQRLRQRTILAQAQNGGTACGTTYPAPPLSLEEIEPCVDYADLSARTDCKFGNWRQWTECTALCNGGLKHRSRGIVSPPAAGGDTCEGSLEELIPCNPEPCEEGSARDCELSPWSVWSHCDSHDQRERYRIIAEEPSKDGKPCNGTLKEIQPCTVAVDCVLSPWTEWDSCDKSCDGGQKQRQRQVEVNPKHRGKPCDPGLIETAGCNREPCANKDVNCKVSIWSVWSPCSATCGPGYQERSRQITSRLSHCGTGCVGNLTEVIPCKLDHCGNCDPCVWGDWKQWSECTRHCGGGQRHRLRNISSWPSPGCEPCKPLDKAWVEPCNTEPCPEGEICVDGLWAQWHDWQACSTSCEGGMRARERHLLRKATDCGRMPDGDSREEEPCNKGVPCKDTQDCILSEWSMWSDCSASCHGIKRRSRQVLQHGYGAGKYCHGLMEEAFPCALGISRSLVNWDSPHLYLNLQTLGANNLEGKGPDFQAERALRYKGAAADNAQTVDLRVTINEESNYNPGQEGAKLNGLQGAFGNIFIPKNSEVVVDFALVDTVTSDPMTPEDLVIKFYNGDDSLGSTFEITAVDECEEFYNSAHTMFEVLGSCAVPGPTTFAYPAAVNSSSRRLQVFNVPWLGQAPSLDVHHLVHVPTPPPGISGIPATTTTAMGMSDLERAKMLQRQQSHVYRPAQAPAGATVTQPDAYWQPTQLLAEKEKKAIAIRFERKSRVRIKFKTGNEGYGHNFLFAVKACLSGHCDPCAMGGITCVFKSWEPWSACSQACEGGVEERTRGVTEGSASSHGGGCDGALVTVRSCNTHRCGQSCLPVDCKWGKWSEWSACSKCAGQKTRHRRVVRVPECGGRRCKAGDQEEIAKCPRNCHGEPICMWSDWSPFSKCSVSCGLGRKKRSRRLQTVHTTPELEAAYESLERLDGHVQNLEGKQLKIRFLAFLAGPSTMLLAFAAVRLWSRSVREDSTERASTLEMSASLVENAEQDRSFDTL